MPRRLMIAAAILRQVADEPRTAGAQRLLALADEIERDGINRLRERGVKNELSDEMNRLLPALTRILDAFDPEIRIDDDRNRDLTYTAHSRVQ